MALFVLSRLLSSLWVSRTGSSSDWCALQEALYKCIDTIQYKGYMRKTDSHSSEVQLSELLASAQPDVMGLRWIEPQSI